MITIKVNGELGTFEASTVGKWLSAQGYDGKKVVVELNGAILKRDSWDAAVLKDGDALEIVGFVGGG